MLRALTSLAVGAPGAAAAAAQGVAEWLAQQTLEPLLALAGHSSWRVQVGEAGLVLVGLYGQWWGQAAKTICQTTFVLLACCSPAGSTPTTQGSRLTMELSCLLLNTAFPQERAAHLLYVLSRSAPATQGLAASSRLPAVLQLLRSASARAQVRPCG